MRKSQADRSVIAARAASRPVRVTIPAHLTPVTRVVVTGPVRKTRSKSGAGSSSYGYGGGWAASMTVSGDTGAVCHDAKWSATVRDHG